MQLTSLALIFLAPHCNGVRTATNVDAAYDEFRKLHRPHSSSHPSGDVDGVAIDMRRKLFAATGARVHAHNNRRPAPSWSMRLNQFADYTDEERSQLLGHVRRARYGAEGAMVQLEDSVMEEAGALAASFDWGSQGLQSVSQVRNQGACGSCWAHAAAGAIEVQLERATGNATKISTEQLTACSPNPQKCGGTGGCKGATAELGFEYARTFGLALEHRYPGSYKGRCVEELAEPTVKVTSWVHLPENDQQALMSAVSQKGPVAVSVDGGQWFLYHQGIYDSCEKDAVVNHAVLLVGYGEEAGKLYWKIRNSWGAGWGEAGHIRLLRHENGSDYCGTDHEPEKGVGCEGGPPTLPVCGMCGILSDSSYPDAVSVL